MKRATCPECGHPFRYPSDHAAKSIACPHCRARVRVPRPDPESDDHGEDERRAADSGSHARSKHGRDNPSGSRPRGKGEPRPAPASRGLGFPLWALIGGGAAVLVALAGLGLLGWFLLGRAGGPPGSGSPAGGQAVSGLKPVMAPLPNPPPAPPVAPNNPGPITPASSPPAPPGLATTPGPATPVTGKPPDRPSPPDPVAAAPPSGEKIYQRMLQSAAWILTTSPEGLAHGSGAVIDKNERLLITNHHVISDANTIAVVFPAFQNGRLITENAYYLDQIVKNKRFERGTVVRADPRRDLALVQLEKLPDSAIAITPAGQSPQPGQQIWSLGGNPRGSTGQWILGSGTVRQVSLKQYVDDVGMRAAMIIESQVPINSGDSGGPVVDVRGQLVGINASTHARSTLNANHIDITEVVDFVKGHFRAAGKTWAPPMPLDIASAVPPADTARLVMDLRQGDDEGRQKAALALRAQGPQARTVVPDLLKLLRDPRTSASLKRDLASALAEIGPPAQQDVAALADALADAQCLPGRVYASDALAKLGPAARPAIKALADAASSDPAPEVRRTAVTALGKLGPSARQETQAVLLKLLRDPDNEVRAGAERGLLEAFPPVGTFVRDSPGTLDLPADAAPALGAALASPTASVRQFAAYALGTLHDKAGPAAPALAQAIAREKQPETRMEMFWALREIGPPAAAAVPTLKEILGDPTSPRDVNLFAALALLKIDPQSGPPVALPALAKALPLPAAVQNVHPISLEVRRRAAADLKRAGKPAAEALADAVARTLRGDEPQAVAGRLLALDLIEKMGPDVYTADLAAKLRGISNTRGEDLEVRNAARRALAAVQK